LTTGSDPRQRPQPQRRAPSAREGTPLPANRLRQRLFSRLLWRRRECISRSGAKADHACRLPRPSTVMASHPAAGRPSSGWTRGAARTSGRTACTACAAATCMDGTIAGGRDRQREIPCRRCAGSWRRHKRAVPRPRRSWKHRADRRHACSAGTRATGPLITRIRPRRAVGLPGTGGNGLQGRGDRSACRQSPSCLGPPLVQGRSGLGCDRVLPSRACFPCALAQP
jgi:hypothetical protein